MNKPNILKNFTTVAKLLFLLNAAICTKHSHLPRKNHSMSSNICSIFCD